MSLIKPSSVVVGSFCRRKDNYITNILNLFLFYFFFTRYLQFIHRTIRKLDKSNKYETYDGRSHLLKTIPILIYSLNRYSS